MAGFWRGSPAVRSVARAMGSPAARGFGAAAVRAEYDSEEELELAFEDACGEREGRSIQWVFMGNPSSRRRAYASRIALLSGVPYISMGSLVRKELHPLSAIYKQIASAVNEGKLVPEDIIFALLSQRLEEGYARGERGFILDGIPRNQLQAKILDQMAEIDLVVNLKCKEDYSNNNLSGTSDHARVSKTSATDSFVPATPQTSPLKLYSEQNKQLEEYYRNQRKLLDFHVSARPRETWQRLLTALQLTHIHKVNSYQTLTP